jgi:hypothetical protein
MHFFDGGMAIFPFMIMFIFVAMMIFMFIARTMIGRGRFRSRGRGHRGRRGSMMGRGHTFFDEIFEDEEKPQAAPASVQQYAESRPTAKSSATKESRTTSKIQAHLDKARTYQKQINDLIKSTPDRNRARRQELATQVSEWIKAIEDLSKQVGNFQQNTLIHQDLNSVPQAIEELEVRLANESNETTRKELERTLASRKNQLAALERLQDTVNQSEIKAESTLSALGTIYSQLLTAQSTNQVADYSRLSAEVDEEVRTLQDHLEALDEVKLGNV